MCEVQLQLNFLHVQVMESIGIAAVKEMKDIHREQIEFKEEIRSLQSENKKLKEENKKMKVKQEELKKELLGVTARTQRVEIKAKERNVILSGLNTDTANAKTLT
ncbi:hypothetical protein ILUMI_21367 [Ignelater luminosus]|uniref:Uncharacterized protein n=1 Tax=Ignelater luminosus TaxID=2038154 RepID=A0A8K0G3N1_IGNLU|nr:hypothetical protein ILUMI_21367 [Ignelater luminosus]